MSKIAYLCSRFSNESCDKRQKNDTDIMVKRFSSILNISTELEASRKRLEARLRSLKILDKYLII